MRDDMTDLKRKHQAWFLATTLHNNPDDSYDHCANIADFYFEDTFRGTMFNQAVDAFFEIQQTMREPTTKELKRFLTDLKHAISDAVVDDPEMDESLLRWNNEEL